MPAQREHAALGARVGAGQVLGDDDLAGIQQKVSYLAGLGVTAIPRSVAEQPGEPIVLRPFGPEPITWPVSLVWRSTRRQPPAAKAFLSMALAAAAEREPAVREAA